MPNEYILICKLYLNKTDFLYFYKSTSMGGFIGKRKLPLESRTVAGYEFELGHGMF